MPEKHAGGGTGDQGRRTGGTGARERARREGKQVTRGREANRTGGLLLLFIKVNSLLRTAQCVVQWKGEGKGVSTTRRDKQKLPYPSPGIS